MHTASNTTSFLATRRGRRPRAASHSQPRRTTRYVPLRVRSMRTTGRFLDGFVEQVAELVGLRPPARQRHHLHGAAVDWPRVVVAQRAGDPPVEHRERWGCDLQRYVARSLQRSVTRCQAPMTSRF
jgi:hypothetical protein